MAETVTLDSIIKQYIIEKGDSSKHNFQRYLQLAINGLQDLDYDVSGQHAFIEVCNHNYSIPIPDDSLNIIGVFFQVNGRRVYIPQDKRGAISTGYACGVSEKSTNGIDTLSDGGNYLGLLGQDFWGSQSKHWKNGQFTGGVYNAEGGSQYTFWVNEQQGVIELSTNCPPKVVLEYLPTRKTIGGSFEVHPFLQEPLLTYIKWRANVHRDSPNEQQFNHSKYVAAKMHLKKRLMSFTPVDFANAIRRSYSFLDKF